MERVLCTSLGHAEWCADKSVCSWKSEARPESSVIRHATAGYAKEFSSWSKVFDTESPVSTRAWQQAHRIHDTYSSFAGCEVHGCGKGHNNVLRATHLPWQETAPKMDQEAPNAFWPPITYTPAIFGRWNRLFNTHVDHPPRFSILALNRSKLEHCLTLQVFDERVSVNRMSRASETGNSTFLARLVTPNMQHWPTDYLELSAELQP
jgi:hypothetical protein